MKCKGLRALAELLQKLRTVLSNQRHSMAKSKTASVLVKEIIDKQLTDLKAEIKRIYQRMEELIREEDQQLITNLCSIPGIGKKTAMLLFICTNGFKDFENSRQLSSFFGLSPTIRQSGSSVNGRSRISKSGNKDVRKLLFMCSMSAYKYNKPCKNQFEKLVNKGKSKQLALIAICNKLLKQSFAIAQSGIPYDENFRSVKKH